MSGVTQGKPVHARAGNATLCGKKLSAPLLVVEAERLHGGMGACPACLDGVLLAVRARVKLRDILGRTRLGRRRGFGGDQHRPRRKL